MVIQYRKKISRSLFAAAMLFTAMLLSSTIAESRGVLDRMLFHPRKEYSSVPEEVSAVKRQEVSFTSSHGDRIRGWLFDLPNSDKIALVSEGNGGNMAYLTRLAEILIQCKSSVLLYDYEGYGDSDGSPSLGRVIDDSKSAYDFMIKTLGKDKKIVLVGVSLGTGVTCQLSTQRKADAIILTAPFTSLLNMARMKNGFFRHVPTIALPRQHLDNVAVLSKPHPPVLIVHGTADTLIPLSEAEKLFAAATEPKSFVQLPDAGHNDIFRQHKDEYLQAVRAFFSKYLDSSPAGPRILRTSLAQPALVKSSNHNRPDEVEHTQRNY